MSDKDLIGFLKLAERMRSGFRAYCAHLDLTGMRETMKHNRNEALHRLNDFQQGLGDALTIYPGGHDYRVCFLADSAIVVKELKPGDDSGESWASFCGHLFSISGYVHGMETNFGNLGLRAAIAYGELFQIFEPDGWHRPETSGYTKDWFVLTGASPAMVKSHEIHQVGTKGGFEGGCCWHETPGISGTFLRSAFSQVTPLRPGEEADLKYVGIYEEMCRQAHGKTARLPGYDS